MRVVAASIFGQSLGRAVCVHQHEVLHLLKAQSVQLRTEADISRRCGLVQCPPHDFEPSVAMGEEKAQIRIGRDTVQSRLGPNLLGESPPVFR